MSTMIKCPVCGQKRSDKGSQAHTLNTDSFFVEGLQANGVLERRGPFRPGTKVCSTHSIVVER